jgi:hypothetical protein
MTPKVMRLALVLEFLVAIIAVFTAWSEIGGQAALDLMPWGWKLGLGVAMAAAAVAYTAALIDQDTLWSVRTARWLSCLLIVGLIMGVVTYYYVLQEDAIDSDESDSTTSAVPLVTTGHMTT